MDHVDCLSDGVLQALVGGHLVESEAGPYESHLTNCAACAERTRHLAASDTLAAMLPRASQVEWSEQDEEVARGMVARFSDRSQLAALKPSPPAPSASNRSSEAIAGGSKSAVEQPTASSISPGEQTSVNASPHAGPGAPAPVESSLASNPSVPDQPVAYRLGAYQLVEKLGEGGMGAVWKAVHTRLEKTVALKVLAPHLTRNPQVIARFDREMKAVGKLDHPHIIRAMDAGDVEGTHYLVMEYVDGVDLSHFVKTRGPQPVRNACELIRQAAMGLGYAHKNGLVHRDVKPSNLFLTKDGKVKLLDLGLALLQGDASGKAADGLTRMGTILGTPDFMAPEQWENTHKVDGRADLYALGCSLYYLLVGRAPYADTHNTLPMKMRGHCQDAIPDLRAARQAIAPQVRADKKSTLPPEYIPDEVESLYRRLMAKKPEDRPPTGEALAEELLSIIRRLGTGGDLAAAAMSQSTVQGKKSSTLAETGPGRAGTASGNERGAGQASNDALPSLAYSLGADATPRPTNEDPLEDFAADGPIAERNSPTIARDRLNRPRTASRDGKTQSTHKPQLASGGRRLRDLWQILDRRVRLALGGFGAALLLGVIIITIKRPDGSQTTIQENDASVVAISHSQNAVESMEKQHDDTVSKSATMTRSANSWAGWDRGAPEPAIVPFNSKKAEDHQNAWAKYLNVPVEYTNSRGMKFRLIPPGEFEMGCGPEEIEYGLAGVARVIPAGDVSYKDRIEWIRSEAPKVRVRLSRPIYVGTHEVTRKEYQAVKGADPSQYNPQANADAAVDEGFRGRHPVEGITWFDAADFCRQLAILEQMSPSYGAATEWGRVRIDGKEGYRLLTEAEWEFVARAGTVTRHWNGDAGDELVGQEWFDWNSKHHPHPVGMVRANPFGLLDLCGNVQEWCEDGWSIQRESASSSGVMADPVWPVPEDDMRVVRGGTFEATPEFCRSSARFRYAAGARHNKIGVRLALSVDGVRRRLGLTGPALPELPAKNVASDDPRAKAVAWARRRGGTILVRSRKAAGSYELSTDEALQLDHRLISLGFHLGNGAAGDQSIITDEGLKSLQGLKDIESITIYERNSVTDAGVAAISDLKSLRTLFIGAGGAAVTDKGVASIGKLTNLESLSLPYCPIEGESLRELCSLHKLKSLSLAFTKVGDADLSPLACLDSLEFLDLSRTSVTGTGLGALREIAPHIRTLLLNDDGFEEESVEHLRAFTSLEQLQLRGSKLSNTGVKTLASFRIPITTLILGGNPNLNDEAASHLTTLSGLIHLGLRETALTDRSVADLARLERLATLDVSGTQISPEGLVKLRGLLPKCHVLPSSTKPLSTTPAAAWNPTPEFQKWMDDVAKLPPLRQADEVVRKLRELNSGGDIKLLATDVSAGILIQLSLGLDNAADISPVAALRQLKVLHIDASTVQQGKVSDLSPIKGLPLTALSCSQHSNLVDLSPLTGMPLTDLGFNHASVKDLSPLKGMKIRSINCANTPVENLEPLRGMPLEHLGAPTTRIEDLSPLKESPLTSLGLNGAPVSDLEPLRGMKLNVLHLVQTAVADLTPLHGMPIRTLVTSHTNVSGSGTAVVGSFGSNIQVLDIQGLPVSNEDLAALAPCKRLETIYLHQTKVTDAGVIRLAELKLPLKRLQLSELPGISDAGLSRIAAFKSLEWLDLYGVDVTDDSISELSRLKQLTYLNVARTRITDDGLNKLRASLPKCQIIPTQAASPEPQSSVSPPASGKNHALRFNGKDSYVRIDSLKYDGSEPVTVEAWVQLGQRRGSHVLHISGDFLHELYYWDHNWGVRQVSQDKAFLQQADFVPRRGGWYHLAATWDLKELKFYVNGRRHPTLVYGSTWYIPRSVPGVGTYLGGEPPEAQPETIDRFFDGLIDEVRVSKGVRYTVDFSPQAELTADAATLALFRFEETDGDVVRDSSGHEHHGKIVKAERVAVDVPPADQLHLGLPPRPQSWYTPPPPDKETADLDRRIAEKILALSAMNNVTVRVGSSYIGVNSAKELPTENFALVGVWIHGDSGATNADVQILGDALRVRTLHLGYSRRITDEGLTWLGNLAELDTLNIWHTGATGKSVERLKGMAHLREVWLDALSIGDEAIAALGSCPRLQSVSASNCGLSDRGMKPFGNLQELRTLILGSTPLTNAGIAELAKARGLSVLVVIGSAMNQPEMEAFTSFQGLESLTIGGLWARGQMLNPLAKMTSLTTLQLHGSRIDSTAMSSLSKFNRLEQLSIDGPNVDDADLTQFRALTNLVSLSLPNNAAITDKGLARIASLPKLRQLNLNGTKVTRKALVDFRESHPNCEVHASQFNPPAVPAVPPAATDKE